MADDEQVEIERLTRERRHGVARELLAFLIETKKWWLAPILLCVLVLGFIALLGSSPAAPFLYTLF